MLCKSVRKILAQNPCKNLDWFDVVLVLSFWACAFSLLANKAAAAIVKTHPRLRNSFVVTSLSSYA